MVHNYMPFLDYIAKGKMLFVVVSLNMALQCFLPLREHVRKRGANALKRR